MARVDGRTTDGWLETTAEESAATSDSTRLKIDSCMRLGAEVDGEGQWLGLGRACGSDCVQSRLFERMERVC